MSYRNRNRETVVFEGKIEFKSAKSYLVSMTLLPGKYFVPFSQILNMDDDPDENGNRNFEVTEWWWKVKEPIDE